MPQLDWDETWDQWATGAIIVGVTMFAYGMMFGAAHFCALVGGL